MADSRRKVRLHAIVNIGDIPPHAKLALRGKIYWIAGSLADLAEYWKRDFPSEQAPASR
jgi:hypothetical protein